ncbi:ATP-binding protein [Streptomyces sp. NPDC052225]|uniref:sensor histidine kinase n=1 Tax=Streptomyces sp. NPDC052225 TaxID=3154949 RepID=UPI00343C2579
MNRIRRLLRCLRPPGSVRWRLTLLYSGLFVLAAGVLLAFVYAMVAQKSGSSVAPPSTTTGRTFEQKGSVKAVVEHSLEAQRDGQLHRLLVESGVALGLMALASLLLGWLVAGHVLAPLRTMALKARRISADDLHERLAMSGRHGELGDLADTFDALLARLEGAFEAQKRFVANASHELRTPVTLQQAVVDVALDDPDASAETLRAACRRVRAAAEEQERTIEALLMLARSQRGLEQREYVDLADVVRDVLPGSIGPVRVTADLAPAPLLGDRHLVERLVGNLVDNAVRHNRPDQEGSWVAVWTGRHDGRPTLRVGNSGPPVPADQVASLFEPFRRLGAERTRRRDGLGLGLSIVAAVAAAHGGRVRAWPGGDAGGLLVEAAFPAV